MQPSRKKNPRYETTKFVVETPYYIPDFSKNGLVSESVMNVVIPVRCEKNSSIRYVYKPIDIPSCDEEYCVDLTDFIFSSSSPCLIADPDSRRFFLHPDCFHDSRLSFCTDSHVKSLGFSSLDSWNSHVDYEESVSDSVCDEESFSSLIPYAHVRHKKEHNKSDENVSAASRAHNDVQKIMDAIPHYWVCARDQNGHVVCSKKDSQSLWFVGYDRIIQWALSYKIDGDHYVNPNMHKIISSLVEEYASSSTNTVFSGKQFIEKNDEVFVSDNSGGYYRISSHGVSHNNTGDDIAFIYDDSLTENYNADLCATEECFFSLLKGLNMTEDSAKVLMAWIISAVINPHSPMPIALFKGKQCSGKSTAMKIISQLLFSYHSPQLTPFPSNIDNLHYHMAGSWLTLFDNTSKISHSFQNVLCIASTGGSVSMRKLYTNKTESYDILGPTVISTIHNMNLAEDFKSRILNISTRDHITHAKPMTVSQEKIEQARGALFIISSKIIRHMTPDFIESLSGIPTGRFPLFFYTVKALEQCYPQQFTNTSTLINKPPKEEKKEKNHNNSIPQWIQYIVDNNVAFSGQSTEIHSMLAANKNIKDLPHARRILRQWNEHKAYWQETKTSTVQRTNKKRTWTVSNKKTNT